MHTDWQSPQHVGAVTDLQQPHELDPNATHLCIRSNGQLQPLTGVKMRRRLQPHDVRHVAAALWQAIRTQRYSVLITWVQGEAAGRRGCCCLLCDMTAKVPTNLHERGVNSNAMFCVMRADSVVR